MHQSGKTGQCQATGGTSSMENYMNARERGERGVADNLKLGE
jgi:hypothetical protein